MSVRGAAHGRGGKHGHGRDVLAGEGICCVGDEETCLEPVNNALVDGGIPTDFAHRTVTGHHTLEREMLVCASASEATNDITLSD